tara:strand:+ start:223 stop:651 length:429 start_codon:yes stop_codon:yes gene_type:complete
MSVQGEQRNATRNQSTVDISRGNVFLYNNRYQEENLIADAQSLSGLKSGILLVRNGANVEPAKAENLTDVIGILKIDGTVDLADGGKLGVYNCISGDIDVSLLTPPNGVVIDDSANGKAIKDVLTGLGFVLFNVTENSKFDN